MKSLEGAKIAAPKETAEKPLRAMRPRIDLKICQNNYKCVIFCPHSAVRISNSRPAIDYNKCTGCLVCLRECPANAISEEREQ